MDAPFSQNRMDDGPAGFRERTPDEDRWNHRDCVQVEAIRSSRLTPPARLAILYARWEAERTCRSLIGFGHPLQCEIESPGQARFIHDRASQSLDAGKSPRNSIDGYVARAKQHGMVRLSPKHHRVADNRENWTWLERRTGIRQRNLDIAGSSFRMRMQLRTHLSRLIQHQEKTGTFWFS